MNEADKVYQRLRVDFTPTEISVLDDVVWSTSREPNPDDDWDRGDTHTDHHIRGITVGSGHFSETIDVCFRPVPGLTYYLLYANYDTGNSFGHDSGRVDFIDLYYDETLAWDMARKLMKEASENRYDYEITMQNGKTQSYHAPYIGYFESLNDIVVVGVVCQ